MKNRRVLLLLFTIATVLGTIIVCPIQLTYFSALETASRPHKLLYTLVHISDVQDLSQYYPETLNYTFQWIESKKDELKIVAVIITGDLVNTYNDVSQWENYLKAKKLTTVPIYEVAGNHDNDYGRDFTYYNKFIGVNETFYVVPVTRHFMLIGISWNGTSNLITESTLKWIEEIIEKFRNRYFIVATHYFINRDGSPSPLGKLIYRLHLKYPRNVVIVLCGHIHTRLSLSLGSLHVFVTNVQERNQSFVRLLKVYSDLTLVVELWRLVPKPEKLIEKQAITLSSLPCQAQKYNYKYLF